MTESLFLILITRLILGIAVAGIMVGCTTLIGDYFEGNQRHQYMGYMAAFGSFGGVAYLFLGGLLAELSWNTPFLIYGFALLFVPFVMWFLTEPQTPSHLHNKLSPSSKQKPPRVLMTICCLMAIVEVMSFYVIPVHLPFYLQSLDPDNALISSTSGSVIALCMLMTASVAIAYQKIKAKLTFAGIQALGLIFLAAGFALTAFSTNIVQVTLSLLLAGIGLGLIRPNIVNWLISGTPPELRGRVMGVMTSCFFLGQFICPLITQPILDRYGYASLFQVVAAVLLIFGLGFLALQIIAHLNQSHAEQRRIPSPLANR